MASTRVVQIHERETDFCGTSAWGKEILDVRDVCFASQATTVEPEGKENRKIEHFAFFARDKSGFLPAKNKESSFDALSRAKREKYV